MVLHTRHITWKDIPSTTTTTNTQTTSCFVIIIIIIMTLFVPENL